MQQHPFDKSLQLKLKSSSAINTIIVAVHLLIASVIVLVTPSIFLVSLLLFVVIISYVYFYYLHVSKVLRKSVLEVYLTASGEWSVLASTGRYENVELLSSSFSSQYLIILNFCTATTKTYTLLIVKDMMGKDEFRHLRVCLKVMIK